MSYITIVMVNFFNYFKEYLLICRYLIKKTDILLGIKNLTLHPYKRYLKGYMSDPVTNYNNIEDAKVSVSIKKSNANKCTLSEVFLSEILKRFSTFYSGYRALVVDLNKC